MGTSKAADADPRLSVGPILAAAGFPTKLLVLDFETFYSSKFSLSKLTIPLYVHDPRFRIHGLAVRWPGGRTAFQTDVEQCLAALRQAFGDHLERITVVAHNWRFDGYILNTRFGCHPPHVVDTLDLARHVHPTKGGHKLRDLATAYGLTPKGEITNLSGIRELNPQQLTHLAAYARHDVELASVLVARLLPEVSRPEVELRIAAHTAKLFTERGVRIDCEGAAQLLEVFDSDLQSKLAAAGIDRKTAGGNAFLTLLTAELAKDGRSVPMKEGKNGLIPAVAKTDQPMSGLVSDANLRVASLAQARLAVKSAPQFQKRLKMFVDIATVTDGILPVHLNYCGAHTGRFSGGGGTNLQNLAKHLDGPSSQFRRLIRPAPGHRFAIADLAQIEARVLAWLAGQDDLVEAFREGRDVYSEFASEVTHKPVRKPEADDSPEVAARLKARRQLGKQAILGLGYQMGPERFWEQVQKNPL
ncbi:MAG: DNA polymerase, partial [Phycisphaerae bacterium]